MKTVRRFAVVAYVAALMVALAGSAHAQKPPKKGTVVIPPPVILNPNPYLPNGVNLNQYAYNISVLGRAYSQIPPYILGYNPYTPTYYGDIYPLSPTSPMICLPPQYVPGSIPYSSPTFLNPNYYTNPFFSFLGQFP
jgi:hypothetical protein